MDIEALPEPGQQAPEFSLVTDRGELFRLADCAGRRVVLFFYPQADTEGCTIETQEFDALLPEFARRGAVLAGISPDPVDVLARFRRKYGLTVELLSDPDHRAIGPFGLWREKVTFGRSYVGLVRTTVLIGPDGRMEKIWKVTRIKGHAAAVLAALPATA